MQNDSTTTVTREQLDAHYATAQPEKVDWLWEQYVLMSSYQREPMTVESFEFAMSLLFKMSGDEAQS